MRCDLVSLEGRVIHEREGIEPNIHPAGNLDEIPTLATPVDCRKNEVLVHPEFLQGLPCLLVGVLAQDGVNDAAAIEFLNDVQDFLPQRHAIGTVFD